MEIIGCATDISTPEQAASAEERGALADRMRLTMVAFEPRDFFARSEQQWDPLMQRTRLHVENALVARRGRAAGLLDQPGDGIRLVKQAQAALAAVSDVGRIKIDTAARE